MNSGGETQNLTEEEINLLFKEIYYHIDEIRSCARESDRQKFKKHARDITDATEELFLSFKALILKYVNRFRWVGEIFVDDMIQVASMAFVGGVKRYDPSYGTPFIAYITKCIHNKLKDYVNRKILSDASLVTVSSHAIKLNSILEEFKTNPIKPTDAYLATAIGVNIKILQHVKEIAKRLSLQPTSFASFDEINEEGSSLHDFIPSKEKRSASDTSQYHELIEELNNLPPKFKDILEMHMIKGMTFGEIGKQIGLTRSRVQQLEVAAIKKLKSLIMSSYLTKKKLKNDQPEI
jgi:RNA polymerase sigma-B factor